MKPENVKCPKCGGAMVSRVNKAERRRFWGCRDYHVAQAPGTPTAKHQVKNATTMASRPARRSVWTGGRSYTGWVEYMGLKPTMAQHRACLFLERQGYEFLKDFGTANAVQMAKDYRAKIKTEYKSARKGLGGFRSRRQ